MIVYISRCYKNLDSAGYKAKCDMEDIMSARMDAKNIGLSRRFGKGKLETFFLNCAGIVKACFSLGKGDVLVLQYPVKKYFSVLCQVAHFKGAKVVALIHDLGSMRRHKLTVKQEVKRLSAADFIIALNPSMQEWLKNNGVEVESVSLGIWDYLTEVRSTPRSWEPSLRIMYAGGLARRKSSFIYCWGNLSGSYMIDLYGKGYAPDDSEKSDRIAYHGFKSFGQLISENKSHFGLVWDGDSIDSCSGNFGEYLKFNNPHKASLYLRCGLPLIVWSESALAPFVVSNGIGIAVDSLSCLDEQLGSMSRKKYDSLVSNVVRISEKIADGYYFKTALTAAIESINKKSIN